VDDPKDDQIRGRTEEFFGYVEDVLNVAVADRLEWARAAHVHNDVPGPLTDAVIVTVLDPATPVQMIQPLESPRRSSVGSADLHDS
jgi:hypothetical protein